MINPYGNKTLVACRLKFECTNNTTEYEALVHGIEKVVDLGVSKIQIYGDSKIVAKQVINQIHCISPHLLSYRDKVRELLRNFDECSIDYVPRNQNYAANLLANVASKLIPSTNLTTTAFSVQLLFRPSVPDNVTNFWVFDDDDQIINFISLKDVFKDLAIDDGEHERQILESCMHNVTENTENEPKENCMPWSVVKLENLFDFQDNFKKPTNCKSGMLLVLGDTFGWIM